jgi:hypothetical protein
MGGTGRFDLASYGGYGGVDTVGIEPTFYSHRWLHVYCASGVMCREWPHGPPQPPYAGRPARPAPSRPPAAGLGTWTGSHLVPTSPEVRRSTNPSRRQRAGSASTSRRTRPSGPDNVLSPDGLGRFNLRQDPGLETDLASGLAVVAPGAERAAWTRANLPAHRADRHSRGRSSTGLEQ